MKTIGGRLLRSAIGFEMRSNYRFIIARIFASGLFLFASTAIFAQAPRIEKVDPPSWWAGMKINPVRLLVRGENLRNARVSAPKKLGIKTTNFRASENGHYLFFEVQIPANTAPQKFHFRIETDKGSTDVPFEIKPRLERTGRFRGFSPDDVIYFAIPDRFADGDETNNDPAKSKGLYDRKLGRHYHGGDLRGLIQKLPYLKSLGVTAIWTTPFYDNNDKPDYKEMYPGMPFTTGYHGYGATDMYNVDEHLGNENTVREFVETAQKMGFKVIQDQVVNHTGPYSVWANDPPTPTWWNGTVKNHLSNNWQKWTAMDPHATKQTQAKNLDGWFIDILPDFNQGDPEVERYLTQHTIWWIENFGFDAVRMDTLPHVPRWFWTKWMDAIKAEYPNVNVLGEVFDGDPALLAYFQGGRNGTDGIDTKIDTVYDFALFWAMRDAFAKGGEVRGVQKVIAHDWLYPRPEVLTSFLGVHDLDRFMNEPGATIEGLMLAQTLIMTTRGTPLLYYGDEIAMPGGGDPDNRRDFPGGFSGDSRNAFEKSGRTPAENRVWDHLSKLGALRASYPSLRRGKLLNLLDEPQQYAYARVYDQEPVVVVINNDTKPVNVSFDVSMIKELPPNAPMADMLREIGGLRLRNGVFSTTIPARSAGIFAREYVR